MRKIQLLNNVLPGSVRPYIIPFTPIAIPVTSDGKIGSPDTAKAAHYATFVYDVKDEQFFLWEFPERIYTGLCAYQARRAKFLDVDKVGWLEVLLCRDSEGQLSMTSGGYHREVEIPPETFQLFSERMDKLYEKYLSKTDYKLSDTVRG